MLAVLEAMKAQLDAGSDDAIVNGPNGEQLRVRRNPEPGVSLTVGGPGPNDALLAKGWDPAPQRPSSYPDDLPYLTDRAVVLTWMPKGVNLQWHNAGPADPHTLASALAAEGWQETGLPMASMPGMTIRPFRRGDRQRIVMSAGQLLTLLDTPAS